MTALIKSGSREVASVRSWRTADASPAKPAKVSRPSSDAGPEMARLRTELADREEQLAAARADISRAYERGLAEGRAAGKAAAEQDEALRTEVLAAGLAAAADEFKVSLVEVERLAATLAIGCLDKLFADISDHGPVVRELLARVLRETENQTVIKVAVSAHDFADGPALEAARAQLGLSQIELRSDLGPGECRVGLSLGELDAGLGQQWGVLRAWLQGLTRETASR